MSGARVTRPQTAGTGQDELAERRPGVVLGGGRRKGWRTADADDAPLAEVVQLREPATGRPGTRRRWRGRMSDAGMATAEYAVVLLAAVGFAGLLIVILTSSEVRDALTGLVRGALSV